MSKEKLVVMFFVLATISCTTQKNVDDGVFYEDFDNLRMWCSEATLTAERSHSGKFCAYTDADHHYSLTFNMDLQTAKSYGYKSVNISAWCFKETDEAAVGLVTSIESPEKSIVYTGADLAGALKIANSWGKLNTFIELPDKFPDGTKLKVYLNSPKGERAFIDDVQLEFHK